MLTFLKTVILFGPFVWMIMEGEHQKYMLLLGAGFSLLEAARLNRLTTIVKSWPAIAGTILWCVLSIVNGVDAEDNVYPLQGTVLGCAYGLGVGACLNHYILSRKGNWVLGAYIAMCLFMAVVAMKVIRDSGLQIETEVVEGITVRSAANAQRIEFLHFFGIGNLLISTVHFYVLGFGIPLLLVYPIRRFLYPFVVIPALCGVYLTLRLQTRMGLLAGVVADVVTGFAMFFHGVGYLRGKSKWFIPVSVGAVLSIAAILLYSNSDFQALADRFQSAGRDSRLDLWAQAWDSIVSRPTGGGYMLMTLSNWGHNLVLDFALINGILGVVAVGLIYVPAIGCLWRIFRNRTWMNEPMVILFCNGFVATLTVAMINPPFIAFTVYCYIFTSFSNSLVFGTQARLPRTSFDGQNVLGSIPKAV